MTEEDNDLLLQETRRANDELWGLLQSLEIHVRAHMSQNLSHIYELARRWIDHLAETAAEKEQSEKTGAASTASSSTRSTESTGKGSSDLSYPASEDVATKPESAKCPNCMSSLVRYKEGKKICGSCKRELV